MLALYCVFGAGGGVCWDARQSDGMGPCAMEYGGLDSTIE